MSETVAIFTDHFGENREIHRTKGTLRVRRASATPVLKLNQAISRMFGDRVRALRNERGWTLEELSVRAGLRTMSPKQRMWEIENSTRSEGVRLGTIYAIALALGVEVADLLPPTSDVAKAASVRAVSIPELKIG